MKSIICILGIVLIVEGIPYFISPVKVKSYLRKMLEIPDEQLRTMGLVAMLFGLFVTYVGSK